MIKIFKKSQDDSIPYSVLGRESNSTDFLTDPELYRDPLPQPYRRIDKILQELLDHTWDVIEKTDTAKKIEAQKYRPDKIARLSVVEGLQSFNCLSTSEENSEFLFIGSNGLLTCVDVDAMNIVDKIELNDDCLLNANVKAVSKPDLGQSQNATQLQAQTTLNTNIISVHSCLFKSLAYLVISLTDTGYVLMHLFIENKFFLIGFDVIDGERKFSYKKCEISSGCNYIALFAESKTNANESQIEVYKCPKELWNQFIENVFTANESARRLIDTEQDPVDNAVVEQIQQLSQQAQIPKPVLISRIKPPANLFKIQPAVTQDVNQLLKKNEIDYIGTGVNHCFSKFHLDLKQQFSSKCFNNIELNEETINNSNDIIDFTKKIEIEFKFMFSSRFINLQIFDQQIEIPNNLAVCWNTSSCLLFYPFNKVNVNAKDMFCQIEYCMPFASQITLIETSKCKNLIALAFKSNNVIVFDLNAGIDRCCVHLANIESIKRLSFIPPITYGNKTTQTNAKLKISTKLICLTDAGIFQMIDCTLGSMNENPSVIFVPTLASRDDVAVDYVLCKNMPMLALVVSETKKLFIMDIYLGQFIIELHNNDFNVCLEQHQLYLASRDSLIYLKSSNQTNDTMLICHSLKLIPKLEDYFARNVQLNDNYLPVNSFLNERIKNLMKIRIDEYPTRSDRLRKLWVDLNTHKNK